MKPHLQRLVTPALALVMLALAAAACGGAKDGAITVRTAFSGADIRYDYPADYRMPPGGPGDSALTYLRYLGEPEDIDADRMLFIETLPTTGEADAGAQLDEDVGAISSNTQDFSLIKRTTTRVAGYDAELVAFTATFPDTPVTSMTVTTWVAYFYRDGHIWEMGVMTNADLEGAAEADYRALADSFAFE